MKLAFGLLIAAAAGPLAAQAGEPPDLAAAFGNTVVSTYSDGRTQRIWLHPDGSWQGINRAGRPVAGSWKLQDEKVCLHQSKPIPLPINYCTEIPARSAPGAQWASRDVTGRPIQLSLEPGIQKP